MKLSELLARPQPALPRVRPPDLDPLRESVGRICARFPDLGGVPRERDREAILRRFARRVATGDWRGCTFGEAARALRIACLPEFRRPEFERALGLLVREIRLQPRRTLLAAAVSSYLETWRAGDDVTLGLARSLSRLPAEAFPARWRTLVRQFPALFDAWTADRALAAMMEAADNPWAALRALGVPDPHGPGLWAAAQRLWLQRLAPALATEPGVARLLLWLRPDRARPALPGARAAEAIAALIRPWGERMPPQALADRITGRLTELYGDPRLRMDGPWAALDRGLLGHYRRWLAGANLRLFLDVITEAERRHTRADESHMWEPRRRFWLGLFEEGRISEAWPAFSTRAKDVAQELLRDRNVTLDYGTQTARSNNTSILLMKIDDKIVVEGSHSYAVHIFCDRDGNAPRLYRRSYDCDAIRLLWKHAEIRHQGKWQTSVRLEIERRC